MRTKRETENVNKLIIKQYNLYDEKSPEYKYSCITTKYALNEIKIKLVQYKSIENIHFYENKNCCETISDSKICQFSSNFCTCHFFVSMGLPCRHIFYFKCLLNESLFDESLVNNCWKKLFAKNVLISNNLKVINNNNIISKIDSKINRNPEIFSNDLINNNVYFFNEIETLGNKNLLYFDETIF